MHSHLVAFVILFHSLLKLSAFSVHRINSSTCSRKHLLLRATANPPSDGTKTTATTSTHSKMNDLNELESLSVTVIVDNECDTMSSGLTTVDGFQYNSEQTKHAPGAENMCMAGHGLSLLLTATTLTKETHTILLDAGPTPDLWKQNAAKLHVDMADIEAVVLSHYHYDHSGGLRGAVPAILKERKQQHVDSDESLLVDLQSSGIATRGRVSINTNQMTPHHPDSPSASELRKLGANVLLHDKEHTLCNDCFYVSGYIPRNTFYEKGLPGHVTLVDGVWKADPNIEDERYIACNVKNHGLVVFSSCSHAGINNVCRDALLKTAGSTPLFGVLGGLHLAGARVEERIAQTVADLKEVDPSVVIAGHCTGWRGKAALADAFPNRFQPLAVGGTYVFHA
jgi:7,8-dihydropterin-6-yl-methyl-4-(beta-D-ribofuranosyl)aminobenzene 5'-phosphate synthase